MITFKLNITQEDSVLKYQKIEPKFKHGPGRLGIKGEVQNTINVDVICPKWSKSVLRPCGGRPLVVVAVETPA